MSELAEALRIAVHLAREAGDMIRRESWRPDGPRGYGSHADVDDEVDAFLRDALAQAFPSWSYYGEETGLREAADVHTFWLVDPNDGTMSFLRGFRESAVSIALIREGVPVLGVVYAPCAPDDTGDLIAWAEGCGALTRNGCPLDLPPLPAVLLPEHVVLVSQAADHRPAFNLEQAAPARYRGLPSIAYRLALVAAGEAEAAVSLAGPGWLDFAGGHALLRARGGEVTDAGGQPIRYPRAGNRATSSAVVGASLPLCALLGDRAWSRLSRIPPEAHDMGFPARLPHPRRRVDPAVLARAQGALLGHLAGDALGSLVVGLASHDIRLRHGNGPRTLVDGGGCKRIAGQPTDDAELALALARDLVARGTFDESAVFASYRAWLRTQPLDIGTATRQALLREQAGQPGADASSEASSALARVSPLGIAAHTDVERAAAWASCDAALTHPAAACRESSVLLVRAIGAGLAGATRQEMYRVALEHATPLTRDALERAQVAPPADLMRTSGGVRTALQNAFHRLLHAESLAQGVIDTAREGGDTHTHAAITGALLGAHHGRAGVPAQWQRAVLTCRPSAAYGASGAVRPPWCWPVDALALAERLLSLGA